MGEAAAGGAASGAGTGGAGTGGESSGAQTGASANGGGASTAQSSSGSAAASGGVATDWTSGFPEDLRGYIQNKGFKAPLDVVESYRGAEKLLGVPQDQILRVPTKADDAEGWNKIFSRLGRPEKASEYNIPMPKEGGDEGFKEWAQNLFHESGLSKSQAEKIASKYNEYAEGLTASQVQAHNAKVIKEEGALKTEWGKAFDQNVNVARRAANELGIDAPTIDALEKSMGFARVVKLFQNLGSKFGEARFVDGNSMQAFNGVLTPAQAKDRLNTIKGDPDFVRRYAGGDHIAREEMARLHGMAYPDPQ